MSIRWMNVIDYIAISNSMRMPAANDGDAGDGVRAKTLKWCSR